VHYAQRIVNPKNRRAAIAKHNPTIVAKACIAVRVMQRHVRRLLKYEQDATTKIKQSFQYFTLPSDLKLNLTVNHLSPLSTKGASARALTHTQKKIM
jgi:hypothetical protein